MSNPAGGGAQPGAGAAPPAGGERGPPNPEDSYRMILDYLDRHGHARTVATLKAELQADKANTNGASTTPAASGGGRAVSLDSFADKNAPLAPKPPATAAAAGGQGAATPGTPAAATPGPNGRRGTGGSLLADPPSWEKGFEGLRGFVENSLDIHRPELHPLLLPLFVHCYLDLVLVGYRDAADHFLTRFSSDYSASDPHIVRMLAAIRNEAHVRESEEATRWRQERYHVRLSERGWGLLLGWLQGGGLAGSIEGTEARGRDRVLAIINERVKVDAIAGPPASIAADYGLASDVNQKSANLLDELKLGPAPMDPKLEREVQRTLKKDEAAPPSALANGSAATGESEPNATGTSTALVGRGDSQETPSTADVVMGSTSDSQAKEEGGLPPLVSPFVSEMLPYPSTLRTIDVAREVEKVREARKRIKLGTEVARSSSAGGQQGAGAGPRVNEGAKPSVCLFTIHDAGESLTTTAFSEDSTLMAAGFSESYIRLWNLKGNKLEGIRNDYDADEITDAAGLKKIRQQDAPTTRKLVGHSGPVYALSFDPVPGPSAPPRYLLSASQDATVRLWSLETYTNIVAYRGHREPVWDVQWGPRGIYFATASRDRTARLWSSDKTSALRIFAGHLSDVNCVRFHPNSLYLATGSSDRTCRLWDIQKGICVRVFVGHRGSVSAIAMSPDGRYLASAGEDYAVILWDLASGRRVKTMTGHTAAIYSLSFSAESSVLVSGGADATVRAWDVLAAPVVEAPGRKFALANGGAGIAFSDVVGGAKRLSTVGVPEDAASGAALGLLPRSGFADKEPRESADLLVTMATKRTPVLNVHFTPRNLVLAAGPMQED